MPKYLYCSKCNYIFLHGYGFNCLCNTKVLITLSHNAKRLIIKFILEFILVVIYYKIYITFYFCTRQVKLILNNPATNKQILKL